LLHEPHHAFARTGRALLGRFSLDASAALNLVTGLMHLLDAPRLQLIGWRVRTKRAPLP
jgi:hypothetical protein